MKLPSHLTPDSSGAAKAAEAKSNVAPTKDSLVSEFGKDGLVEHADGKWEYNVSGRQNWNKAHDMMAGVRAIDIERGAEVQAKIENETLLDHRGRDTHVPLHLAEMAAMKRGLKPKRHYGRAKFKTVYHSDGTITEYERINGRLVAMDEEE